MQTIKVVLETVVWFVDGEPRVKTNQPINDEYLRLLLAILEPFSQYANNRFKLDAGYPIRIRATFLDEELDSYTVGFTHNTNLTNTVRTTTTNV
jgi:hypothetical protein